MTVDAGRIKLVGRWFVRSFGHYDVNEIQHRARQLCTSFTPAHTTLRPCVATHLHWPSTCSACPAVQPVHLPPPSPSPTTANVGSFAWRPRATPSPFSAFYLLRRFFPFLPSPFFTCPAAHFALISSQLCMQKCNVLLVFYLPNPPSTTPFLLSPPLLVGILLRVSYSSVSSVSLTLLLTQRQLK